MDKDLKINFRCIYDPLKDAIDIINGDAFLDQRKLWKIGDKVYNIKTGYEYIVFNVPYYSEALNIQYFWAARIDTPKVSREARKETRYKYLSSKRCIKIGVYDAK